MKLAAEFLTLTPNRRALAFEQAAAGMAGSTKRGRYPFPFFPRGGGVEDCRWRLAGRCLKPLPDPGWPHLVRLGKHRVFLGNQVAVLGR